MTVGRSVCAERRVRGATDCLSVCLSWLSVTYVSARPEANTMVPAVGMPPSSCAPTEEYSGGWYVSSITTFSGFHLACMENLQRTTMPSIIKINRKREEMSSHCKHTHTNTHRRRSASHEYDDFCCGHTQKQHRQKINNSKARSTSFQQRHTIDAAATQHSFQQQYPTNTHDGEVRPPL